MDQASLTQSPFAVLTFIAAPALLTNSSSVLALSTINRMLRTRDRMKELFAQSQQGTLSESERQRILSQVDRVEKQSLLLLSGLRAIYVALAAFAGATLVTLVGAALFYLEEVFWFHLLARLGLIFGFVGVGGLILGTVRLFSATQLSVINIRQEAAMIREMQTTKNQPPSPKPQ